MAQPLDVARLIFQYPQQFHVRRPRHIMMVLSAASDHLFPPQFRQPNGTDAEHAAEYFVGMLPQSRRHGCRRQCAPFDMKRRAEQVHLMPAVVAHGSLYAASRDLLQRKQLRIAKHRRMRDLGLYEALLPVGRRTLSEHFFEDRHQCLPQLHALRVGGEARIGGKVATLCRLAKALPLAVVADRENQPIVGGGLTDHHAGSILSYQGTASPGPGGWGTR
jgi:hypothetical protein